MSHPTATSVTFVPAEVLPLPAVTVCNYNPITKNYVQCKLFFNWLKCQDFLNFFKLIFNTHIIIDFLQDCVISAGEKLVFALIFYVADKNFRSFIPLFQLNFKLFYTFVG